MLQSPISEKSAHTLAVADGKASNTNDDDVAKMDEIVPQPQPPQISRTLHPLDNEAKPKGSAIRWRRGHHDNGADKNRSKSILSSRNRSSEMPPPAATSIGSARRSIDATAAITGESWGRRKGRGWRAARSACWKCHHCRLCLMRPWEPRCHCRHRGRSLGVGGGRRGGRGPLDPLVRNTTAIASIGSARGSHRHHRCHQFCHGRRLGAEGEGEGV